MMTADIPKAVAERMRAADGSAEARRKLRDLHIEGSWVDEETGNMHFEFFGERRIDAIQHDKQTGEERTTNIPVDGFILAPKQDWALVGWFLRKPAPN